MENVNKKVTFAISQEIIMDLFNFDTIYDKK
jgi:hypothetical protein